MTSARAPQLALERARELRRDLGREDVEAHEPHARRAAEHLERGQARARLPTQDGLACAPRARARVAHAHKGAALALEEARHGEEARRGRDGRALLRQPALDDRGGRLAVEREHGVARAQSRLFGLRVALDVGDDDLPRQLAHRDADRDVALHAPVDALAGREDARVRVAQKPEHPAQHRVQLRAVVRLGRARPELLPRLVPVHAVKARVEVALAHLLPDLVEDSQPPLARRVDRGALAFGDGRALRTRRRGERQRAG